MTSPVIFFLSTVVANPNPTAVLPGDPLYITGQHFTTATDVTFNGVSVPFTIDDDEDITVTVPTAADGSLSGRVVVTNPDGSSTSTRAVVICTAGPWQTLDDKYWQRNIRPGYFGDTAHSVFSGNETITTDPAGFPSATAAFAATDIGGGLNSPWGRTAPERGLSGTTHFYNDDPAYEPIDSWGAFEYAFRVDLADHVATAYLDIYQLPGGESGSFPPGVASVRYENTDGHLDLISGGGTHVTLSVAASDGAVIGSEHQIVRLGAGDYTDDTLIVQWVTGSSGSPVATAVATSDMLPGVGPVDYTFTDPTDYDTDYRAGYIIVPVTQDGSDLDPTASGENTLQWIISTAAPLMHPPRFRWISPMGAAAGTLEVWAHVEGSVAPGTAIWG